MPPDGYDTVTIPESTYRKLEKAARDGESIPNVIQRLVEDEKPHEDALTPSEFEDKMAAFVDDMASTTAKRTADEVESRLR